MLTSPKLHCASLRGTCFECFGPVIALFYRSKVRSLTTRGQEKPGPLSSIITCEHFLLLLRHFPVNLKVALPLILQTHYTAKSGQSSSVYSGLFNFE